MRKMRILVLLIIKMLLLDYEGQVDLLKRSSNKWKEWIVGYELGVHARQ